MKNIIKTILKVLLVVVILVVMSVVGVVGATLYKRWEGKLEQTGDTQQTVENEENKVQEECFTCLFLGVNGHLTDFIMLGQYNPNTKDIALLSIPRDTNVTNSVDGKINSIYAGKYPEKIMAKVQELTSIEVQHYVVFDTKLLRKVVDEIGGVTFDVPINMDYDDPYQNLYIHLKKGTQTLSGKQAEQLVRFRKSNTGTGYSNGDVGRIATQQSFIKALIGEVLSFKNISKIGNLVKIVLDGTKTDITMEIVSKYIDDAATIDMDKIRIETLPGEGKMGMSPYGYNLSYYYHDAEASKILIDDLFKNIKTTASGDTESETDVVETNGNIIKDTKIRLEVLNTNSDVNVLNKVVEELEENNYNVIKIGKFKTSSNETSRIIDYGIGTQEELESLKEILGITKVEEKEDESSMVKYSIIIGQNYK